MFNALFLDDKYRVFPTIPDIVNFYDYLLKTPLKEKFAFKQYATPVQPLLEFIKD